MRWCGNLITKKYFKVLETEPNLKHICNRSFKKKL